MDKLQATILKTQAHVRPMVERSKKVFKMFPLAESTLEEIEAFMSENTFKNFYDPEFPPVDASVFRADLGQQMDSVVHWRRPHEFMISDSHSDMHDAIKLFLKDIEPSDIKPGPHSYKWILCAIASLAERPALVHNLFVTKEYKPNGAYRMKVNKSGVWMETTIDDYMPCALDGPPLFTRTHGNELWVQLLEKAYAKMHGCYSNLY